MAEDILIQVKAEVDKAINDIKNLGQTIQTTQSTVNNKINPAINNFGTKLTSAGTKVSAFGEKVKGAISGQTALAFTALGAGLTSFTKSCIDSAIKSESAWTRFGALVNQNGDNWSDLKDDVKSWATDFSNNMGYATSDTREASLTFLQMGMNVEQMKSAMEATAGVASRAGLTEAEASTVVSQALMGKGKALQKYTGLRLDDYKTADGQIDKERLLHDLYTQNEDAIKAHGATTEAQMNRIHNSMGKLKTGIGNALLPVVTIIADVVQKAVDWFNKLEGPIKPILAGFLALVAGITTFIGVLGMIAPIIINVGNLISSAGKFLKGLKLSDTIANSWNTLKDKVGAVKDAVSKLNIGDKVKEIKTAVINSWGTLKDKINSAKNAIVEYDIKQKIVDAGGKIKDAVLNSWNTLTTNIGKAKDAITGFELRQKLATISQKAHTVATTIWSGVTKVATMIQGALNAVLAMNPIYLVVIAVMALIAVLTYLYFNNEQVRNAINALGSYLQSVFVPIWNALKDAVMGVINWFSNLLNGSMSLQQALSDVFNFILKFTTIGTIVQAIGNVVPLLVNTIIQRLNGIITGVRAIFNNVVNAIRLRLQNARAVAGTLANAIRNIIQTRLNLIIARVRAIFQNIVNNIRSRLANAVSTARQKAVEIYNSIVTKITELPSKVGAEISNLANKIKDGLVQAGLRAFEGAKNLVAQFLAGMGINSPGIIQNSTVSEFASLTDIINSQTLSAGKQAYLGASNIVNQWATGMGDGLKVPTPDVNPITFDVIRNAIKSDALTMNMDEIRSKATLDLLNNTIDTAPVTNRSNISNLNRTEKTLIIEEVNLDCHDFTKAESKNMLWNAIEGAYGHL